MTIKSQLYSILISIFAILILSLVVFQIYMAPIGVMKDELEKVERYHQTLASEAVQLGMIYEQAITDTFTDFEEYISDSQAAAGELERIKRLPGLNDETAEIMENILKLSRETQKKQSDFLALGLELSEKLEGLNFIGSETSLHQLYQTDLPGDYSGLIFRLNETGKSLHQLLMYYEVSLEIMEKRVAGLEKALEKKERRNFIVIVSLVALLLMGVFFLAMTILSRIGIRIHRMARVIQEVNSGKLVQNLESVSRDDLGLLIRNTDEFLQNLRLSFDSVKNTLGHTLEVKDSFKSLTFELQRSIEIIEGAVAEFRRGSEVLDEGIDESGHSIMSIAEQIQGLEEDMSNQSEKVEQSTASVSQMISALEGVHSLNTHNREITECLSHTARNGEDSIIETGKKLAQMGSSVDYIQELTQIIAKLASQTNLLAMNAAIEAAHAGEQGYGFAVVADEIRNLAEASSQSSKEIRIRLNGIIGHIQEVQDSGNEAQQVFTQIASEVVQVQESYLQVYDGLEEFQTGGKRILKSMEELKDSTAHIREKTGVISESSSAVNLAMERISEISQSMKKGSMKIESDTRNLTSLSRDALRDSHALERRTTDLKEKLSYYQTAEIAELPPSA